MPFNSNLDTELNMMLVITNSNAKSETNSASCPNIREQLLQIQLSYPYRSSWLFLKNDTIKQCCLVEIYVVNNYMD